MTNTNNRPTITTINGVDVPRYPYTFQELHGLLKNVHTANELDSLGSQIDEEVFEVLKEHRGDDKTSVAIRKAYVESRETPFEDKEYNDGYGLFVDDFTKIKSLKFKRNNAALYTLMSEELLWCGMYRNLYISQDREHLLLLDDRSLSILDVTSCVFKAIKEHYGLSADMSFKCFFNDVYISQNRNVDKVCRYIRNVIAETLWDLETGENALSVEMIKTAEEAYRNF